MPVNSVHRLYQDMLPRWSRCRDAHAGSDAIKAARTKYLPALGGQSSATVPGDPYSAYLLRAMFYPAMARTVTGLAGLVFGKAPSVAGVPVSQQPEFLDVTLSGVSLAAFAVQLCQETLITGRVGLLIDFPEVATPGARPYWLSYPAEAVINWRVDRIAGRQIVTLLVLHETVAVPKADDLFTADTVTQYRVLQLVDGHCVVTVYREDPEHKGTFIAGEPRVPLRRGVPLPFLPFTFVNASGTTADVDHPPLVDLVDVNISHYRTSADMEWGSHFCSLPTPYITGHTLLPGEILTIGSTQAWVLPDAQATAGMVEFSGAGLGSLRDLLAAKKDLMASLGGRLLETQKNVQEAAQTVRLRHAGEGSALGILADALGQALTWSVRTHLWWSGLDEAAANNALVTMNPELLDELTGEDIKTLLLAWQDGAISKKTFYFEFTAGGWGRPEVTFEDEEADIKRETDTLDLPAPIVP